MAQELELTERTPESKIDYWRKAWQKACERERDCQGQIKSLIVERNAAQKDRDFWRDTAGNLRKKQTEIETAIRNLMDETELDGEGGPSRTLRGYVWNLEDTEALRQAEGIDE